MHWTPSSTTHHPPPSSSSSSFAASALSASASAPAARVLRDVNCSTPLRSSVTRHTQHWHQQRMRLAFSGWRQLTNQLAEAIRSHHATAVVRSTMRSWLTHARYVGREEEVQQQRK